MAGGVSIAIETSSRAGGVALGRGGALVRAEAFDAGGRHAVQLLCRLEALLAAEGLRPGDLEEVYISAGPGSFTGLRVGVTVARTLAQAVAGMRCVAVPTALAVAENAAGLAWTHLAVVFDARSGELYAQQFRRGDGEIAPASAPAVMTEAEFLAAAPRPVLLVGEGLAHHDLTADGVEIADAAFHVPTAGGVWRVGRRMAARGQCADYHRLLPIYTRRPEAVRLWEQRHSAESEGRASADG